MSEQSLNDTAIAAEIQLTEFVEQIKSEIEQIPKEYLPELIQMIRLFHEIVVMKQESSAYAKAIAFSQLPEEERKKKSSRDKSAKFLGRGRG